MNSKAVWTTSYSPFSLILNRYRFLFYRNIKQVAGFHSFQLKFKFTINLRSYNSEFDLVIKLKVVVKGQRIY